MKIENSSPPIILLHPGKTGGTSIEHTLKDLYLPKGFKLVSQKEDLELMFGMSKQYKVYLQHADLRLYKILNVDFKNYKTITTVRRPYERILSCYFYNGKNKNSKFEDFVCNELEKIVKANISQSFSSSHFCPQTFYSKIDDYTVDHIIKLENFNEDCKKANLKVKYHFSKTIGTKKYSNYLEAYNQKTKDIVYNLYKEDFEDLGYER
jgi:hypothetical protein